MKDIQELTQLFRRYIARECSEDEIKRLFQMLSSDEKREVFLQLIEDSLGADIEDDLAKQPDVKEVLFEARQKIARRIGEPELLQPITRKHLLLRSLSVAALLLCACALTFFFDIGREDGKKVISTTNKVFDIEPGGNKATLTLADGSKISLTDANSGKLANQQGVSIAKSQDGEIVYTLDPVKNKERDKVSTSEKSFNTIATPRGGQYKVVLPDGSKVWLNAASSISYPVQFGIQKRRVVLNGEAYFEVAAVKDKKRGGEKIPFIVASGNQEVEVLGTHFNINGYADEPLVRTTLLEGKVRVRRTGGASAVLAPGQQSQTSSRHQDIRVLQTDVKAEVAWKDDQFFFEDEPIESIMRQISRWYDVDVVYQDDLNGKTVWGSVTRFSSVSKVLKIIELTGNVHFKIEGRTIIVMK